MFTDANGNGNGVMDKGEAAAVTTTTGQFTLFAPSGELVATAAYLLRDGDGGQVMGPALITNSNQ